MRKNGLSYECYATSSVYDAYLTAYVFRLKYIILYV